MLAEALSVKPAEHFSMFGCFGTLPPPPNSEIIFFSVEHPQGPEPPGLNRRARLKAALTATRQKIDIAATQALRPPQNRIDRVPKDSNI